jgi:limonene-1,2-epoxide hydrolase
MFVPKTTDNLAHGLKKDAGLDPEEFATFHHSLLSLIKDVHITIDKTMEQGNVIVAECTLSAVNRKSDDQRPIAIQGCTIAEVTDGKIRSANNYFDFLHLFEGLELLPENTFQKCLSGKKVSLNVN